MTDESVKFAVPAITLGYHVCNDEGGQFKFYFDDLEIILRRHVWTAYSDNESSRVYSDLETALISENWRIK